MAATLSDSKRRGRPPEFNRERALHAAMLVFWEHGFEGASLLELSKAMRVSRPTLYAAFADKEHLLREAVKAYMQLHAEEYAATLRLPTSRAVIESWLRLTGGVRSERDVPPGCLLIQGALVGTEASYTVQAEMAEIRNNAVDQLEKRFQRALKEGDLPGTWKPRELAQLISCIAAGLAVQSRSGSSPAALNHVIDQFMANWPITSI